MIGKNTDLERVDVCVKAIWLLYRRGKWRLLELAGVSQNRFSEPFRAFDLENIVYEHGRITNETQVLDLLEMAGPEIVEAAVFMLHMFWTIGDLERMLADDEQE
jgi:hypothetical protein